MIEPLISLTLREPRKIFKPGDQLDWEFQIDAVDKDQLVAVEASVLWYTEGKGDEDIGVHFFERRVAADVEHGDLRTLRKISVTCPESPLSYEGDIIKVRWCVRVRLFLKKGKGVFFDHPFQLGEVSMGKSSKPGGE